MFGRRRRAASNPHSNTNASTADPSATTAAAQAFLAQSRSNANLSAAAAATALRSRPTSPTNVAEVQTKRTLRRSASTSSRSSSVAGSSVTGRPSPQLERRLSSSSMSERTFREPSPNRGVARPSARDAPPVPAIPAQLIDTAAVRRRAASAQPGMRISSPPPNQTTGRGMSLQPPPRTQTPRRAPRVVSMPSVDELTGTDRPGSRGSVNFSLPTSLQRRNSDAQWTLTRSRSSSQNALNRDEMVYDPNTRTFRTRADMLFYEQSLRDIAEKPVRRKKSLRAGQGSHLAEGTVGGRMKGTTVEGNQKLQERQIQQPVRDIQNEPSPQSQRVASPRNSIRGSSVSTASDNESEASERTPKYGSRSGMQLGKRPSVVTEDRQREEAEDDSAKVLGRQAALRQLEGRHRDDRGISPSPLPRTRSGRAQNHDGDIGSSPEQSQSSTEAESTPVIEMPKPLHADAQMQNSQAPPAAKEVVRRGSSLSPNRNAHFLDASVPISQLSVRHEPPSRSISPRKSALKRNSSPRGPSPLGENSAGWTMGHGSGELSDASTNPSEDLLLPRKRSVRVSFDEGINVIVDEEAGPTEARRVWSGSPFWANKSRSTVDENEPDMIMGPRPVLPSFGSVRKKEHREPEDRPLVKPLEARTASPVSSARDYTIGPSSDHAVGAVLSQEQAMRNEANISKSREPLPPQVTLVDGSGYASDSDSSVESIEMPQAVAISIPVEEREPLKTPENTGKLRVIEDVSAAEESKSETSDKLQSSSLQDHVNGLNSTAKANGNANPPTVTLTHPTPILEQEEWQPDVPGGLPENSWESDNQGRQTHSSDNITETETPASVGIAEPTPVVCPPESPVIGEIAAENLHQARPKTLEADSSDGSSVYSDAAEQLTDAEGDGFMSLDAVVEIPVDKIVPGLVAPERPASPSSPGTAGNDNGKPAETAKEPDPSEGWAKTQRYWSGLTEDKRREMEQQALRESDESSDEEPVYKPQKKPPRKSTQAAKTGNHDTPSAFNRTYQIRAGAKAGPNGAPALPASLRRENGDMRKSLRAASSGAARAMKSNATSGSGPGRPPLRRTASADSCSSFKRERPAKDKDGYRMRNSMRASSPVAGNRFSMRALSPAPRNPPSVERRASASAVGGSPKSTRRTGLFGRSKVAAAPSRTKERPQSRFVDSSDEEGDVRPVRRFQSRFADSSDEEEEEEDATAVAALIAGPLSTTAFRGDGRRRVVEDDSSDLPDSEDETLRAAGVGAPSAEAVRMARAYAATGQMPDISAGQTYDGTQGFRAEEPKRGGLMGILRRKRRDPEGKVQRKDFGESGARRDTPLERSRRDLEMVRRGQTPKLRKRGVWGVREGVRDEEGNGMERPATSEGFAETEANTRANALLGAGDASAIGVAIGHGGDGGAPMVGVDRPGVLRRSRTDVDFAGVAGERKGREKKGFFRRLLDL